MIFFRATTLYCIQSEPLNIFAFNKRERIIKFFRETNLNSLFPRIFGNFPMKVLNPRDLILLYFLISLDIEQDFLTSVDLIDENKSYFWINQADLKYQIIDFLNVLSLSVIQLMHSHRKRVKEALYGNSGKGL